MRFIPAGLLCALFGAILPGSTLLNAQPPMVDGRERSSFLTDRAAAEFQAGKLDAAEKDAQALLDLAAADPQGWNHDDLIHTAQTLLGRVALDRGDLNEAKKHLLASAKIHGSGMLESFGPSMKLAQELLDAGQRDAVLEYLELCRAFWKYDRGRINRYVDLIRSQAAPDLLAPYAQQGRSLAGANAPPFRLKDLSGHEWTLTALSGRIAVLDFWATWCVPCLEELRVLDQLQADPDWSGITRLAVDVGEDEAVVRKFVEAHGIKMPVLLAGRDAVALAYRVEEYPKLVIIDRSGRVAGDQIGEGEKPLQESIKRIVKQGQ